MMTGVVFVLLFGRGKRLGGLVWGRGEEACVGGPRVESWGRLVIAPLHLLYINLGESLRAL